MDNKKPLREWTLGELQSHCNDANCDKCVWRDATDCAFVGCPPCEWDLTDPPRWTREDVEDAKAIKRLYPKTVQIERNGKRGTIVLYYNDDTKWYALTNAIPSLELEKRVFLEEILDAEENLNER